MTKTERFAEQYRVRVTRDECNDPIMAGRRGHLYFDSDRFCLTVLDGMPANRSRWKALGGTLWMGDISRDPKTGKNVQDVKIEGIPLENARLAIRMAQIKPKRIMSEAQKVALDRARSLLPTAPQMQRHTLESSARP